MISIIIPTHDRRAMVLEAVDSVLAQHNVPCGFEVIVVDDGSTDGTSEALSCRGTKIRYLRQDHSGVSAARNLGIAASRGEHIAFLDSDDLWLPGKLSKQMEYFYKHPDILICQTQELWVRDGKRINPKKYHQKPEGHCFSLLLERCLISPSAVAVRRELFDSVGLFDERLPACEDYDLWLRIGCRYPIGLVHRPLVIKRGGHPDQLSATIPRLDRYRMHSIINLLCTGLLEPDQVRRSIQVLSEKAAIYAQGCRKRGKQAEADRMEILVSRIEGSQGRPDPNLLDISRFLLQ
ncbi:MAG: glycosyltransferase [Syntrophobacteraceae bacterium]